MTQRPLDSRDESCDVLVIGDPAAAEPLSRDLKNSGIRVRALLPDHSSIDRIEDPDLLLGDLTGCGGFTGVYRVDAVGETCAWRIQTAAIVIALDERRVPEHPFPGAAESARVHSLGEAENLVLSGNYEYPGETVVLLNGLSRESHPAITGRMLSLCLRLRERAPDTRVVLITNNLKVAGHGIEALAFEARRRGTFIYKLDGVRPAFELTGQGRVRLSFFDPAVRQAVTLTADRMIVDEHILPPPRMTKIAEPLRLRLDPSGFGQADNVRRLSNLTNRRGIFVAGAARGVLSDEEQLAERATVCEAVKAFLAGTDRPEVLGAVIDTSRCGRCLTCYRICPYAAVHIGDHMEVVREACQACGLCAAACPAKAIGMQAELTCGLHFEPDTTTPTPRIALFCCQRSAGTAYESALASKAPLPAGMVRIQVPCGGRVGTNDIAAAFEAGADGVMVLACHEGNCHSEIGSRTAGKRVAAARKALTAAGIEPERIFFAGIAANMSGEIVQWCNGFDARLRALSSPPVLRDEKGRTHHE